MSEFLETATRVLHARLPDKEAVTRSDLDSLAADIISVLGDHELTTWSHEKQAELLSHVVALYVVSYHKTASAIAHAAQPVFARLTSSLELSFDQIGSLYDGLLFLHWCSSYTIDSQRGFGDGVVPTFVAALSNRIGPVLHPPLPTNTRLRIAYLGQFCYDGNGNALSLVATASLKALRALGQHDVFLYAWLYHTPEYLEGARSLGITVRSFSATTMEVRVAAITDQLREDQVDVVITDMNSAVPTALFLRRVAPVQIYFQLGIPFWPVPEIDAVLLGWHVEASRIGFRPEQCHTVTPSWDLTSLDPPVDADALAAERALFPPQKRLIGMYGRLAKVTPDYLAIAARLVSRHPDVVFAIGGSGDAAPIRAFLDSCGLTDRFVIVDRFVDGHLWGHLLEVFLDTWPLHGGYAVREAIAKGVPTVSLVSSDMPNLSREKDPNLVANTVEEYEAKVNTLLLTPSLLRACRRRGKAIARHMAKSTRFGRELERAILSTIRDRSP